MPQSTTLPEENQANLSTEDQKLISTVVNAYTYSKNFYSVRQLKFRQWLRLYHRIPEQKAVFRSNLFIPLVFSMLSTVLPRMVANLPTFRFEPREESDQEPIDQMSALIDYEIDQMDFFKKFKAWVKDTLMYGSGILKCYWKRDDREEINDPEVEVVDLFDFFPDPKAVAVQGGDFMIHRTIRPITELKRAKDYKGKPLYKNLDNLKTSTNEEASNKLYVTNDRAMTIGDIDGKLLLGTPYRASTSLQVELLEYWGIYGPDDDEYCITVANRQTVVRVQKNDDKLYDGKRPFIKMEIDPNNYLFFGTGLIEPLEHLQIALNDTRNQRMDNVNLILNKIFLVLKEGDVNENELVSRPGGVIYQAIKGAVEILETPDITGSAYQEEAIIKQDAQEAIGVTDIVQGQISDVNSANVNGSGKTTYNETAKGAQIAVEQAGSRFKYYMQNIEDALRELGEFLYEYTQKFMSEEKVIRIEAPNDYQEKQRQSVIGKIKGMMGVQQPPPPKFQWLKIRPDAIRNLKLDVKVEAGSTQPIEETLKQQKVMNLLGMLGSMPVVTPETFMELASEILDAYKTPNKDKILQTLKVPDPQPTPPKASISVALKGDLNPFETADIAKQLGATPQSTDPGLVSQLHAQEQHDKINAEVITHHAKGMSDMATQLPPPPDAGTPGQQPTG